LPTELELEILEPFRDQVPEEVFTTDFEPVKTDGTGRIRSELRTAWQLFSEAGWEIQGNRLVNVSTGAPMRLTMVTALASSLRYLEPFANNLKRAGIDASVRVVDTAQYQRLTDQFDYDMIAIGANFFPPPNEELRTYFSAAAADEIGSANWAGIRNPVVDQLLERIVAIDGRGEEALERLKATTRSMDRVLLWNHYIVNTYYAAKNRFAYWDLFGRPSEPPVYGVGFPESWWWEPEEAVLRVQRR
jgi:microcin C transport system substrate-binding protein